MSLISSKPRAATIKCLTDCEFAIMSKQDYLTTLSKIDEKSKEGNSWLTFNNQQERFIKFWISN